MTKPTYDYDLVVIGDGPAGLTIGRLGPRLGARVAIVEADRLGGDCTWHGCVPSKALLAGAHAAALTGRAAAFGLPAGGAREGLALASVLNRVHARQERIYAESDHPDHLRALGCDVIAGRGRFVTPNRLAVDGRIITARRYCIATGSRPAIPPISGLDRVPFLTNETVFNLAELPPRLLVVGGGPVGVELGQAFARLGSAVTIVEMLPRLLSRDDAEITDLLRRTLESEGLSVVTNATVTEVHRVGGETRVRVDAGGHLESLTCDALLIATGRRPSVEGLNLEEAEVAYDITRGITVNTGLRTTNPHIYACGDVIGRAPFTRVALYEAGIVIRNALFPFAAKARYDAVPWAVFTDPEVAHLGLTEAEAQARYGAAVRVYRTPFARNDRAVVEDKDVGLVKIICVGRRDRIVGAHIIGPAAGELIHTYVVAMRSGMSARDLAHIPYVYPTLSESARAVGLAALDRRLAAPWLHTVRSLAARFDDLRRQITRA